MATSMVTLNKACVSIEAAPLELGLEVDFPPEELVETPAGRVGTDVPVALARQDEAAAFAAPVLVGAWKLTVPFLPKLQACGLLLLSR